MTERTSLSHLELKFSLLVCRCQRILPKGFSHEATLFFVSLFENFVRLLLVGDRSI